MHANPFTLSVIAAAVIGGVGMLSSHTDQQEPAVRPAVVAPAKTLVQENPAPLSTASPVDIDPRRMQAPGATPENGKTQAIPEMLARQEADNAPY